MTSLNQDIGCLGPTIVILLALVTTTVTVTVY